jgi:hypothetical protein
VDRGVGFFRIFHIIATAAGYRRVVYNHNSDTRGVLFLDGFSGHVRVGNEMM